MRSAVELKLSEQRKFVLWWDGQEKRPGPGRGKKASRTGDGFSTLSDLGLNRDTVHRWRARLTVRITPCARPLTGLQFPVRRS
jgi:hypothetical protein